MSCTPLKERGSDDADDADAATAVQSASASGDGCKDDADCAGATRCSATSCEKGRCVVRQLEDGVSLGADDQIKGDCRNLVCDSLGRVHTEDDDADKPDGDGNPCHDVTCEGGALRTTNMEDGSPCNDSGTCSAGQCSECIEGGECPRANDCTIFEWTCKSGGGECEDTGVPREGRACEQGKVCSRGICTPCVVGDVCDVEVPCHVGRRTSCAGAMECEPEPVSNMSCGEDAMGRALYCAAGECVLPCREGPCMSSSDSCQTSHWDCSMPDAPPVCVAVAIAEGTSCGEGASCHDGACVRGALVNGDFHDGFDGWALTGDAEQFSIATEPEHADRRVVSTSADGPGAAARGTVSQAFVVPDDALALRFNVSGGQSRVRLKDERGTILEECDAASSNDVWRPVSWELVPRRGQRLTIAIEDSETNDEWAFIRTTGFDVIREVEAPLRNSQFERGLADWETSGEGQYFNVYTDFSWSRDESYGHRMSVSTYARETAARLGAETRGVVSQKFVVPLDAFALRFNVCGGSEARVTLYEGSDQLSSVSAGDSDATKIPVSWALQPHRGKTLRIAIEDDVTSLPYGYIGATGFDVITGYNGP